MIYLDASVALAFLLADDRKPPDALWQEPLVSSRLLEYEVWNRIHSCNLGSTHGEAVRQLLGRVALLELSPPVLLRRLNPFRLPSAQWTHFTFRLSSSSGREARRYCWRAMTAG